MPAALAHTVMYGDASTLYKGMMAHADTQGHSIAHHTNGRPQIGAVENKER